jgi:hypothetical protein
MAAEASMSDENGRLKDLLKRLEAPSQLDHIDTAYSLVFRAEPTMAEPFPCPTLRCLALPYADRANYRQEWKP